MKKKIGFIVLAIIITGFLLPQRFTMPVEGAKNTDFNPKSFWHYPWGKSVTHKGVDIFAEEGTKLHASTDDLVIYSGHIKIGGNVLLILGPKWRFHYYAHLHDIKISSLSWVSSG